MALKFNCKVCRINYADIAGVNAYEFAGFVYGNSTVERFYDHSGNDAEIREGTCMSVNCPFKVSLREANASRPIPPDNVYSIAWDNYYTDLACWIATQADRMRYGIDEEEQS